MRKKAVKAYKNELSNEYLEKIKENSKIFDEKMNSLNQRKIKIIKPKSKKKKARDNPKLFSINQEEQFNYSSPKKRIIRYITDRVKQMTIFSKRNKKLVLSIDNNISFYYLGKRSLKGQKNYSEEDQDIIYLSKIRQLQKDIKYKADLIIELQTKLKEKDDNYVYISIDEMRDLKGQITTITKEKDDKIRRIKQLETDNYNQKCTIDNLEARLNKIKNGIKEKDEEIYNLNNVIDKFKIEEGLYEQKVNCLESVHKSSVRDIELLKTDLNKMKTEKDKLQKVIDEQRTKMDNYRKHINTLRKFICDDDLKYKIKIDDSIILNNNDIIDKTFHHEFKNRSKSKKSIIRLNKDKKKNIVTINDSDNREDNDNKSNGNNDDNINEQNLNNQNNGNDNEKKINKLENKINNLENKINSLENKKNNLEIVTPYDFKKGLRKTNSDLDGNINNEILKINPYSKSKNKDKIRNRNKEQTISSFRKKRNRKNEDNFDDYDDDDVYYNTYNNLEDLKHLSRSQKRLKNDRFNTEFEIGLFPCERPLVERKDEIAKLESQLDLLLGEKNELENEIMKLPEHPKTLKEIKRKRSLNSKLSLNERSINNVRVKIRKIKEF